MEFLVARLGSTTHRGRRPAMTLNFKAVDDYVRWIALKTSSISWFVLGEPREAENLLKARRNSIPRRLSLEALEVKPVPESSSAHLLRRRRLLGWFNSFSSRRLVPNN